MSKNLIVLMPAVFFTNIFLCMDKMQQSAGTDTVSVDVLDSAAPARVSSRQCAQGLLSKVGCESADISGLRAALKHYKGLAGDLSVEPKSDKQRYAREVVLKAFFLGRQDIPAKSKATIGSNDLLAGGTAGGNESIHQFIQQIMNERVTQLSQESGTNHKKIFGLSASTVTFGLTTAAFLATWLLKKNVCSCSQ